MEPEITPSVISNHGLTEDEYARIKTVLARAPNFTELGIFSVMWSEHCSYKNTRRELRKFIDIGYVGANSTCIPLALQKKIGRQAQTCSSKNGFRLKRFGASTN